MNKSIKYVALILAVILLLGALIHVSSIGNAIIEPKKPDSAVNLFDEQKIMGVTGIHDSNPYWGTVTDEYLLAERAYRGGINMWLGHSMDLKPGRYIIYADAYVPTGNAPDTRIALGLRTADATKEIAGKTVANMYLDEFDTWQHISVYVDITDSDTYFLVAQGFGSSTVYKDFGVRFKNIAIYKT